MLSFRRRSFRCLTLLAVALTAAVLAGCAATEGQMSTYVARGNSAREILTLSNIIFVTGAAVFVLVEGLLIYSIVKYRRGPDDGVPLQVHGHKTLEIVWTIIPAIIVLVIATLTFRTQSILADQPQNPLRVTVVGHQWWWEFQYPDLNVVTANELHLPAGRPVEFTLESADVIHSFWIPRLFGKTDVIPGLTNKLTFTPDDTAEPVLFRGQCAEFCGVTHAQMGMFAVVEPQASFDTWVRQQAAAAPVPAGVTQEAAPNPEVTAVAIATSPAATAVPIPNVTGASPRGGSPEAQGYALFKSKGCVGCHAIQGYPGATGTIGPSLTHVASRQHIVAGWLANTPDNMRAWLRDPNQVKPDNIMGAAIKAGTLTEDEIAALTAYLGSLK